MELLFNNPILYCVPIKRIENENFVVPKNIKFTTYKLDTGITFYSIETNNHKLCDLKKCINHVNILLEQLIQIINVVFYPIVYVENVLHNDEIFIDFDNQEFIDNFIKLKNLIPHNRVFSMRHYSVTERKNGFLSITDKSSYLFNLSKMDVNLLLSIFHTNTFIEGEIVKGVDNFFEKTRFWNMNCDVMASYHRMEALYNSLSKKDNAVKWNEEITKEKALLIQQTEDLKRISLNSKEFLDGTKSQQTQLQKTIIELYQSFQRHQKFVKEEISRLVILIYLVLGVSSVVIIGLILILLLKK